LRRGDVFIPGFYYYNAKLPTGFKANDVGMMEICPYGWAFSLAGHHRGGFPVCPPGGVLVGRSPQIWAENANFAL
jgi:hypothetical protein